jgi:hypothetical protein
MSCLKTSTSRRPPLELVLFVLAGAMTLASVLLTLAFSPWFCLSGEVQR